MSKLLATGKISNHLCEATFHLKESRDNGGEYFYMDNLKEAAAKCSSWSSRN